VAFIGRHRPPDQRGRGILAATAAGRRTDAVASATGVLNPSNGDPTCDCTHPINPSNFSILGEPSGGRPIFKLVSGALSDPSDPDQVLASVTLQQDDGVHVGTVIHVPFFSPSQAAASNSATNTHLKPQGPTVSLRVVGIVVSPYDFASGQASSYELYTTPAFTRSIIPHTARGFEYAMRLRGGTADLPRFDAEANRLDKAGVEGVGNLHGQIESIEGSIHPQAIGWFVRAALAALVGLTVIGQAVSRQSVVEGRDYPTLTALGTDQRQLVALGMARNLILAVAGALGAVVLATALSPLAPVGEARLAESSSGISFDGVVFGTGTLAIVAAVLALGIWPAVRAAIPTHNDDRTTTIRHSTIVTGLASLGAPPTALIGVRNALQRRTSGAIVPVGTAFLGTVLPSSHSAGQRSSARA
jgi:hypothetical protein